MENRQHISLREGQAYIDGVKVLDLVSLKMVITPTVASSTTVGSKGTNRRWLGYDITGSLTEYKSTDWLEKIIAKYIKDGKTPELTIQGVRNDKNSDYYATTKKTEKITLAGVVLTGDLPLMDLDTGGELVQNTVNFGAKSYK